MIINTQLFLTKGTEKRQTHIFFWSPPHIALLTSEVFPQNPQVLRTQFENP